MKILYLKKYMHHKNNNALMNYKNISYYIIQNENDLDKINLNDFDCVYSPCTPINVSKYPNTKFIFGPHFSVFPEKKQIDLITSKNVIYTQPSDWVRDMWKCNPICNNIRIETMPFGVDTNKFNEIHSIEKKNIILIYYKSRKPEEIDFVLNFLLHFNYKIKIFNYLTKYSEQDYLNCLHNAKFGIWIGRHESQGFALEEALSCNVPLLVWDVKSMNQEYGYNYPDITATSIPYWSEICGEYFYEKNDFEKTFNIFINKLENYRPREYILNTLTNDICENKLFNLINNT